MTQKIEFLPLESLTDKGEKPPQFAEVLYKKTTVILPKNEGQIRPLLRGLKTDSERIKVWQDAVFDSKGDIQQQQTTWFIR